MRSSATINDHCRRIRRVMIHINHHLDERQRLDQLAAVACFSSFHFFRVFEMLMGETPRQYIIRKRMERAGYYLLEKKLPVTDIAFQVAYGTPSSFCKVFKTYYGISPRRFRDTVSEKEYNKPNHPFRFSGTVRSRTGSIPFIRDLPSIKAICIENRGVVNGSFLNTARPSFDRLEKLILDHDLTGITQNLISIYPFRPFSLEDDQTINYVGALIDREIESIGDLSYLTVPEGRYAIFYHYGSYDFMQQTWNRAYMNWLPGSGRALRDAPPIEIHLNTESDENNLQLKAYLLIPIL